jgi:uncharacterized repeat protein (TIGR03803 family)
MRKMSGRFGAAIAIGMMGMMLAAAIAAPAQTFRVLVGFNYDDGANTRSSLVQGGDGNLYGTTLFGGTNLSGTVFKVSPAAVLTTLYNFCSQPSCTDGAFPSPSLVLGTDGNFYGTAENGGYDGFCPPSGCGTVFRITAGGKLTTLHRFEETDGAVPYAGLVEATDGNFYGTTSERGGGGYGTLFRITPGGTLTTLHNFCSQFGCPDGATLASPLIQASDGNLYGTTVYGGSTSYGDGTVFKITLDGALTTLYSFGLLDGAFPDGALLQASDGNIYGTAAGGGNLAPCNEGCGTIFSLNPEGALTTLYEFKYTDGANPNGGLIQATDGKFYGLTFFGVNGFGSAFQFTAEGKLTVLHAFDATKAAYPEGALVQATNGNFYGTTDQGDQGGTVCGGGCGTVFLLGAGLGPFVRTVPTAGAAGQSVTILGTKLAGATSVTFNGTAASFTVSQSGTDIKTTVPAGATTGPVRVVTPSGTLTSNVNFQVEP